MSLDVVYIGKTPLALALHCQTLERGSRYVDELIDACFHGQAAPKAFVPLYTTDERVAKGLYRSPASWSTSAASAFLDCDGQPFEGHGKLLAASCCAAALFAFDKLYGGSAYQRRFFP